MPFFSKDKKDKEGIKKEKKQDTKNKGGKGAGVTKDESPSPARGISNVNANDLEKQTHKEGGGGASETSLESSTGASKISSVSGMADHYQNEQKNSDTDGDDGTTEVKEALRALHDLKDDPQVAHSGDESASTDADTDATSYITDATGTGTGATTDNEGETAGAGKVKVQDQGNISDSDAPSSAQQTAQKLAAEEEESEEGFKGFGSFKFESADHVDEYLKSLGVGLVFRKVQSAANPTLTIFPCKEDEWAIQMDSIFRTREIKFRLGREFIDETYDGRPCRSVASLEGPHRLIMRQRCSGGSDVRMVYEVQMDNAIHIILISGAHRSILRFSSISDL